jgi:adenylosuccinate synthase
MSGKIQVVVGGQFGSEGKGAVVAHLSRQPHPSGPTAVVRVAGPNAGHSATDPTGRVWALRTVPVAAVTDPEALLVIAAGSEIDGSVLEHEIEMLEGAGFKVRDRLTIDWQATVLEPGRHQVAEAQAALTAKVGSTGKGIGAARADRIMRTAELWGGSTEASVVLNEVLTDGGRVIIEGTQGYGLGLHAGFYPQCTSSDCRAIDFLAMAGLSPWQANVADLEVYVAMRPNPIRVAGNSGPLRGETTWEALGLPVELTTVTRKPRRVGAWDRDLAAEAVVANGGAPVARIALTMADHLFPQVAGLSGTRWHSDLPKDLSDLIWMIEDQTQAKVALVGTGPGTMFEMGAAQ